MCQPAGQEMIRPLAITAIHWGGAPYPDDSEAKRKQLVRDIAMVHATGAKYIGSVNGRGFYHTGMDEQAVQLLDGRPMTDAAMNNAVYKCSLNPKMNAALLGSMNGCVDLGMDGLILDSWQAEGWTLCFCESCLSFYRESLKKHRDDPRMTAIKDLDPATFDYGRYLRDRRFTAATPIRELPGGPALAEYRLGELIGSKRRLFETVRKYAASRGRKDFHLTANVYDMPAQTFAIGEWLDYFSVELPYFGSFDGRPPQGTSIALQKKGPMVGKRCVIQPGCHDTAHALIGKPSTATLFEIWIAEAYASGNLFDMVPREWAGYENGQVVWLDLPVRQLLPYYRFVASHREMYGETASLAKTAVLYSMTAAREDPRGYEREYQAVCKLLYDAHRQFDVVLAGDGRWNTVEPAVDELGRYDSIIVIRPQQLGNQTANRLLEWKTPAKRLTLCGKARQTQPLYPRLCAAALGREIAAAELPSFVPYIKSRDANLRASLEEALAPDGVLTTNAPADVGITAWQVGRRRVIHLVNYGYEEKSDQVRDVENLELRLKLPEVRQAFVCSPDGQRRGILPIVREPDGIRLTIGRLHIYSVVVLE
jgi:hypothetical protein